MNTSTTQTGKNEMNDTLNSLIQKAQAENAAKRYPGAETQINGKTVLAYIMGQCRITKKQKPSVMWKVNGKRVAAKELAAAIAK
jgi:cell fate (sporulation/competence/biofilm development) regulator YmcA (YheA/YmcA/DUF963 family)